MTYIPEALRQHVFDRAQKRCEYCRLLQKFAYHTHEIDHIYAEKHGGLTQADNLCLSCADCNRYKGSNLCSIDPLTNNITALFHPRKMIWEDHFQLELSGIIAPQTEFARVTAKVLQFNRLDLVIDRKRLLDLGLY